MHDDLTRRDGPEVAARDMASEVEAWVDAHAELFFDEDRDAAAVHQQRLGEQRARIIFALMRGGDPRTFDLEDWTIASLFRRRTA